jgi:hypothetical protein
MSDSDADTEGGLDVLGWPRPVEAGRQLGVSAARVKQLEAQGRLRAVRTSHGRLFDPASLEALRLERQARGGRRGG